MTHDQRQRALEAGRILASPVFQEAFDLLDARYVAQWRGAKYTDDRERAWMMQNLLATFRHELLGILQGAAVASGGKDKELNAAVKTAKEQKHGRTGTDGSGSGTGGKR